MATPCRGLRSQPLTCMNTKSIDLGANLSDVARSSLSEQQMTALATYVRELGGGFILAAGETSYGDDGGYSKTEIERVLPITFDAKRPHRSVAMIVVLDKSGSMGGPDFAFT